MAYNFGVSETLGTHTGWTLQSLSINKTKDVSRVLGAAGDEAVINATNELQSVAASYKCISNTNTVPASLGADIATDYVLTEISLTLNNADYADMQLTAHKHNDGTPPAVSALKEVAHGITVAQAFGIAAAPLTGATTANSGTDWQSVSIRIACEHADQPGASGTVVAHENYDAYIEVTLTALSAITAPTGYTVTAQTSPSESNTEYETYSLTCRKGLTLAVV